MKNHVILFAFCAIGLIDMGSVDSLSTLSILSAQTVIYENNFDDDATGIYTVANLNADWNAPPFDKGVTEGRVSIVDGATAYSGKSMCVSYPAGMHGSKNTGALWKLDLDQGYEEVYVEYRVKFGGGFDFVRGGKLPGLIGGKGNVGGNKPNGTDGWSARMHWRTDGSQQSRLASDKANISQYIYHPDQPKTTGEDFRWDDSAGGDWKAFESDRWYHLRHRVAMNTPRKNDGVVQAWLDGELVLDVRTIRFRDVASLDIDQFYFNTFFGGSGSKWNTSKNEVVYFDDLKITTAAPEPNGGLARAARSRR